MSRKSAFTLIFWSLFILITFYLSGVPGLVVGLIAYMFYVAISYFFTVIWRFITRKKFMSISEFILAFSYRIAALMTLVTIFFGGFCFYQNTINPAYLPRYTITDGKKTIIFQTMAHIGTDRFYDEVKSKIQEAKKSGFILFFEGVGLGTPENMKKFDSAMGVVFDKSLYANISKLYGLREQRNKEFLGIVNNKDENVDISIDDIMTLYAKRLKDENKTQKVVKTPVDLAPLVDASIKTLNAKELKLLTYINQAIMNFIMKNDTAQQAIISTSGQQDIFATILDDRNKHLADVLIKSKADKIFVLYGMLHFDGVFALLQKNSPDWHVERVEFEYPVR